jgi:hypothetical protein
MGAEAPLAELVAHLRTVVALAAGLGTEIDGFLSAARAGGQRRTGEQADKNCELQGLHFSPYLTLRIWFTATLCRVVRVPSGHTISTDSAWAALPRPKCGRGSLLVK